MAKTSHLAPIKKAIIGTLRRYHVHQAGLFGSYARGEQKRGSDIDIIIKQPKNMGFKFAGLEIELSQKLKRKVDLVSYNGLSPYLKDRILREEIKLL